jgi:hypothetical protein
MARKKKEKAFHTASSPSLPHCQKWTADNLTQKDGEKGN